MGAQLPVIPEKPFATGGCRKFQLDPLGDHLNTCTTHSGAKKSHDWMVDQVADFFRTTDKVKTQQVVKNRGQHCGDIELEGYLVNEAGSVSLVLDLRITHDRVGRSSDPTLNGHLRWRKVGPRRRRIGWRKVGPRRRRSSRNKRWVIFSTVVKPCPQHTLIPIISAGD